MARERKCGSAPGGLELGSSASSRPIERGGSDGGTAPSVLEAAALLTLPAWRVASVLAFATDETLENKPRFLGAAAGAGAAAGGAHAAGFCGAALLVVSALAGALVVAALRSAGLGCFASPLENKPRFLAAGAGAAAGGLRAAGFAAVFAAGFAAFFGGAFFGGDLARALALCLARSSD